LGLHTKHPTFNPPPHHHAVGGGGTPHARGGRGRREKKMGAGNPTPRVPNMIFKSIGPASPRKTKKKKQNSTALGTGTRFCLERKKKQKVRVFF